MKNIKAYDETKLRNLAIQEAASTWHEQGLISPEQQKLIQQSHPQDFYVAPFFIKIGLFIFTLVACSFTTSIISLIFISSMNNDFSLSTSIVAALSSVCFWIALELAIKDRKMYHSGMDQALIYCLVGSVSSLLLAWSFDSFALDTWVYLSIVLIVLMAAFIRFGESLIGVSAYLCFVIILSILLLKTPFGNQILPFFVMIIAGLSYWQLEKIIKNDLYFYYQSALKYVSNVALILFYLGGNYLIVREGNAMLNNVPSEQIAFAPLFYFLSTIIPLIYIFFGLKNHNRNLLLIGLMAAAFSVFTYRTYFSVLPIEWALYISGLLMILVAVFSIRYLKNPKYGISYQPELNDTNRNLEANLFNAIITQKTQANDSMQFGGGESGGGGADGNY